MNREYLFVYGTLRRCSMGDMYRLLAGHADFIDDASYQGRLYRVDDYPGAVASDDANDRVIGEVYALREPAKILPILDDYEGCGPRSAEYKRMRQSVLLDSGDELTAWVYIYQHPTHELVHIVSGDFLHEHR